MSFLISDINSIENFQSNEIKSFKTTIPFFKNNELDYALISNAIFNNENMLWLILIPIIIFIVTAVSNSNNLTDGLDGLSAGSSAIIVFTLGVFAWTSGNIIFSDYLNIMYIPRVGEITIFIASLLGSLVDFFGIIHIQLRFLWVIQEVLLWRINCSHFNIN